MKEFNFTTAFVTFAVLVSLVATLEAAPQAYGVPKGAPKGTPKGRFAPCTNCDQNKKLVTNLLDDFVNKRDVSRASDYFNAERTYLQHNPTAPDGADAFIALAQSLPPNAKYEPGVVLADGDFVMAHGRYIGLAPVPLIGLDIWRVDNGKLVEHWDVFQPEVPANQTRSGRSMLTEANATLGTRNVIQERGNKILALHTIEKILIGKDHRLVPQIFGRNGANLRQHNPTLADGVDALLGFSNSLPANGTYERGLVMAEGNFVMVHGRNTNFQGPRPLIGANIFRFEGGKLVEHWDVFQEEVPANQTVSGRSMLTPALNL
ncbi:hypothetical protein HK102_000488 [Quaeritorhiza haematococci]|nr:hypothetical protein HK102_000488 [Quaeritorhiza haematococci]